MNLLSAVLDIIVVVTVILITSTSIRRGLVFSVIEFVGVIVSAVASAFLASVVSGIIYVQFIQNNIIDGISNILSRCTFVADANVCVFNFLPGYVRSELISQGINENNIFAVSDGSEIPTAIESLIRPIMSSFITKIAMTIIFTVLLVIVIAVTTRLSKKAYLSELAAPEKIVSCIFGLLKSLILLMVMAILIEIIAMLLSQNSTIAFDQAVDKSLLYKFINNINVPSLIINLMTGV